MLEPTSSETDLGVPQEQEAATEIPAQESGLPTASEGAPKDGTGATAAARDTAPSVQEQVRRAIQSERDKIAHEAEMRVERRIRQQLQQQQQAQAYDAMSDEEFGRQMRESQRLQTVIQEQQRAWMENVLREQESTLLASIDNSALRDDLKSRADRGEYKTFAEYLHAMQAAAVASKEAKLRETIREAVRREGNSQKAASSATQLGAGSNEQMDYDTMTTQEKLRVGFEMAIKKAKGG